MNVITGYQEWRETEEGWEGSGWETSDGTLIPNGVYFLKEVLQTDNEGRAIKAIFEKYYL